MKIKTSRRGLTFSFAENETFKPGTHYRYFIDKEHSEVILVADEDGKYKISRKGVNAKPLVDLRNEEIRQVMSMASYMEVEILGDKIIVHVIEKSVSIIDTLSELDIAEVFDKSEHISFAIDKDTLIKHDTALFDMLKASGLFSQKIAEDVSYVFDTVSLFSGAGLLDYPFSKDESFDLKFAVDYEKFACETYRKNIGEHILCMDIRELDAGIVPDADLIIGGPSCKPFSNANRAGNKERDQKERLLIEEYIRIVKAKMPLMFLVENVEGFLSMERGKYLQKVITELSGDYNITYSVVNDWDLGGYSIRKRMLLIGAVKAIGKVIIPDVEVFKKKVVRDALCKVNNEWFNFNDITKSRPETLAKISKVTQGKNFRCVNEMEHLDRHSNMYRRLDENKPSITITNWRKICLAPPHENRILSVSEAAAIMGLEKDFRFFGSLDKKQQQVGNGVTQAIANFAKNLIKNYLYGFVNSRLGLA